MGVFEYDLLSRVDEKEKTIKDLCDLNQGLIQEVTKLRIIEGKLKDSISVPETFAFKKYDDLVESWAS